MRANPQHTLFNCDDVTLAPSRASDNAEAYLKSLIFSQQLVPGDKLPPERELSKLLGVSTATLRAALRSLETAGLIVITRGSAGGSTVVDEESLNRRWLDWLLDNRGQLSQLLEFAGLVHTEIAFLAAQRRTGADLKALKRVEGGFGDNWRSVGTWHAVFHQALATAAHNTYLEEAAEQIDRELFVRFDYVESNMVQMRNYHEQILAAVGDRDAERAAEEMRAHNKFRETIYTRGYGRQPAKVRT
jgi:GntR family transcriptional repressor for pyruvate dehydrogenase complex